MSPSPADRPDLRLALRNELKQAMRDRQRDHVAAYRIALAAIDNAEAVPTDASDAAGPIETSRIGVGAAEADRRVLTHAEVHELVRREVVDLRSSAHELEPHDPDQAATRRNQAQALERVLLAQ